MARLSVHDVAAYIIERHPMDVMTLQRLLYYAQAWSLVWDGEPLFRDPILAMKAGPLVKDITRVHHGFDDVTKWKEGDARNLSAQQRDTVDEVVRSYAGLTGRQLSHLVRAEGPWRDAREGLTSSAGSTPIITLEALYEYYGALDASRDAPEVGLLDWREWKAAMEGEPGDHAE